MKIFVENKEITLDEAQQDVFLKLNQLKKYLQNNNSLNNSVFQFFQKLLKKQKETKLNYYIYGDVGRGKTALMKNFFNDLTTSNKIYLHFNTFMQLVHKELYKLRKNNNTKEDLVEIATRNIIKDNKVLCFDEFQVDDVTDALILRKMFSYFFKNKINVVITSNLHPRDLYQNGLQRESFLEFVDQDLLKNCQVINLDNKIDYRAQYLESVDHYFYPISKSNNKKINDIINKMINGVSLKEYIISIGNRELKIRKSYKNIAIFDFKELCVDSLGIADYQAICSKFNIIFLMNLPKLSKDDRNEAKRLMLFIDEAYNHKNILITLAETAPKGIYTEGTGSKAFKRTISRLNEINSYSYK